MKTGKTRIKEEHLEKTKMIIKGDERKKEPTEIR